jgi:hypothetical protein
LSTSLSPVLENVIDILVSQNNSASSSTASATFNQHGLDSDVSSWLINQQGLGDKYVDVVVVFLLWCFWIYFVPFSYCVKHHCSLFPFCFFNNFF